MKRIVFILLTVIFFTSCQRMMDYYYDPEAVDINTDFKFSTRTSCDVSLAAIDPSGNRAVSALFSIYTQNPQGSEGRNDSITPIYQGYTDSNGEIKLTGLSIPVGTDSLYIYPEYGGYGPRQVVSVNNSSAQLVFKGLQLGSSSSVKSATRGVTRADAVIERSGDGTAKGVNFKFYSYYNSSEINVDGSLNVGTGLVSSDPISAGLDAFVNSMYPEKTKYTGDALKKTTDLKIVADGGAKVYVTYIGDGGFTVGGNATVYNGMYYYTYTESNEPSKVYTSNYMSSDEYRLTCVFPNTHPSYIAKGTRVQLLYYDKARNMYTETFPKGTYIGFDLNYKGYNKGGVNGSFGFSMSSSKDKGFQYMSSVAFNSDGNTHGIIQWCDDYKCYTVGLEREGVSGDNDFNDILAKVLVNPYSAVSQDETAGGTGDNEIGDSQEGVLAFEDQWPNKGDYDFNDFVTKYKYQLLKTSSGSNDIGAIKLTITPQAAGAAYKNGFGVELPISPSDIDVANMSGTGTLEDASAEKAVIIFSDDIKTSFTGGSGFVNTISGSALVSSTPYVVKIPLKTAISESSVSFSLFNPFIFVGTRGREVHLVDYAPTSKADMTLFNSTECENSNTSTGIYYRMNNTFPWALDISDTSWRWPLENVEIGNAYTNYNSWYTNWTSGKSTDWMNTYDSSKVY